MLKSNRIEWLDLSKGIGIILVIFGHCINYGSVWCRLIFTFHMPLFFLLSGYVFSDRYEFVTLAKKKAKSLLVPFFAFFLMGLAATLIIPTWRGGLSLGDLWNDLLFANPNAVHNSSIWFLMCLFLVTLLFWLIKRFSFGVQPIVLLLFYSFGVLYAKFRMLPGLPDRLPLDIDVMTVAVCFFAVGYYFRKSDAIGILYGNGNGADAGDNKVMLVKCTNGLVISAILTVTVCYTNGSVNLHGLTFRNPVLYLVGGLSGSLAVVVFAVIVSSFTHPAFAWIKSVLLWYGRHSLIILGFQSLLIRTYIKVCENFFGTHLFLYFFPPKHAVISSVLTAFLLCPAICFLIDGAKKG